MHGLRFPSGMDRPMTEMTGKSLHTHTHTDKMPNRTAPNQTDNLETGGERIFQIFVRQVE